MKKKSDLLPTKASQSRCLLFVGIILFMYLFENLPFITAGCSSFYIYVAKPLIWCVVILIIWLFPRISPNGKIRIRESLKWWSVFAALIYVAFMFLAGLINGYGKSPYDLSLTGIVRNFIFIGTTLAGRELVRAYLVNSTAKKNPVLTIVIFTVFMTLIDLPFSRLASLKIGIEFVEYVGENILPELCNNIVATYLVYMGGPIISITYLGIIQGFFWFCPILPNLKWITKALIGTLCPVFSLISIQYLYAKSIKIAGSSHEKRENPVGWIITAILAVSMVWFSVGVFPILPAVVATGSMEPMIYPGDMVLVKKINKLEDINVGDVIQFKRDNIFIFHRIINVVENKEKQIMYQTKGDNNSGPDSELVRPEDIKGEVVKVVPKIGWPTLLLKSRDSVPKEEVEF